MCHELNVTLNGQCFKPDPVYPCVMLDRTLTFREHLEKLADKLKTMNNLLMRLAASSSGAHANTLRSSAVGLCYSVRPVGKYCAVCISLGSIGTYKAV